MRTDRTAILSRPWIRPLASLIGLAALAAPTRAQALNTVLQEGDYILGAGPVAFISKLAVTERGLALVEVVFDVQNNATDTGVLRNGFLSILESTPVLVPGGTIRSFDDLAVDRYGNTVWPLALLNTPAGQSVDAGLYWNTVNLLLEAAPCTAPEVGAGTTYTKFEAARVSPNGIILGLGDVNDPRFQGLEDALFLVRTDGKGNVLSVNVPVLDNQVFPPFVTGVAGTGFSPYSLAVNDAGDWMTQIVVTTNASQPSTSDTGILLNGVLVAREGGAAPVPPVPVPRTFSDMRDPELDLNDFGDFVFNSILDNSDTSTNSGLMKGNKLTGLQKFVQEGDTFTSIAPFTLLQFDSAPIYIANSGDIFWYARTNASSSQDQILFRNLDPIVSEGVTVISGDIVSGVRGTEYSFHISRSGRFWIAEVSLQNSGDGVIMADFGAVVPVPGCYGNKARLTHPLGDARLGQTVSLQMDQAQALGSLPLLFFSTMPALQDIVVACGKNTKFGEVLIGLGAGSLQGRLRAAPFTGIPTLYNIAIPNDPVLINQIFWTQGMFWDISKSSGEGIRLSNGMYIEIGAP